MSWFIAFLLFGGGPDFASRETLRLTTENLLGRADRVPVSLHRLSAFIFKIENYDFTYKWISY